MVLRYSDSRPDVDLPYTEEDKKYLKEWVGEKGGRLKLLLITDPARVDRDIVLYAVRQNGLALQYAFLGLRRRPEDFSVEEDLRDDRKVVLAAVRQNGLALEIANNKFRKDREVVLAAVIQNGLAIKFASDLLRDDNEVIARAFRTHLSRSGNTKSKKTKSKKTKSKKTKSKKTKSKRKRRGKNNV